MQLNAKFTQLCDKRYFYGNVNELIMGKYGIIGATYKKMPPRFPFPAFLNTGEFYTMR